MPNSLSRLLPVLLAGLLGAAPPGPASAAATEAPSAPPAAEEATADPFYLSLLEDGVRAWEAGDFAATTRDLRLACFGLLEIPRELGRCLAYLGLAQARGGDRAAFTETFQRLAAVEERFAGYTEAALAGEIRAELERALALWIPTPRLASIPAFAGVAEWKEASRIAQLPVAERRAELGRRREGEPVSSRWTLMLADLELAEGEAAKAASLIGEVLAKEPENERARCSRGLIHSRQSSCQQALPDLSTCSRARQDAELAEALLGCQVELERWEEARALLAVLPEPLKADRRLARLARQVERTPGQPAPDAVPIQAEGNGAGPSPEAGLSPPSGRHELTEAEQAQLAEARRLLATTRYSNELAEPLRLAAEVADAHPEDPEVQHLVAQIAYRASRFDTAVDYFRRGGDAGDEKPLLLFFFAVSLYETGEEEEAASVLRRCLPELESNAFVESYRQKILGAGSPPG